LKRVALLLAFLLALIPFAVSGQTADGAEREDVLIRVNGHVHVPAGEIVGGVVAISDDALIEGTVDYLIVIDGDATITGTVNKSVMIVNGVVTLADGARVGEDVQLYRATAVQETGATVDGAVRDEWGGGINISRGFWFGLWLSMTVAVLGAGLLFAAVGGRQLAQAGRAVTGQPLPTLVGAIFFWGAVPVLAVLAMLTVVGIPFGIGILLFLLPALWFLGYLVAGAALGQLIVAWRGSTRETRHPYLPVVLGLVLLQVVTLLPFIGGTLAFLAGLLGAGAVAYRAWIAFRGESDGRFTLNTGVPATPAL